MSIHPTAIIESGASIGEDVHIGAFCRIGPNVSLGDGVELKSHVAIDGRTSLGEGVVVHPFAVLGGPPQHLGYKNEDTALKIGARTIIREHVTMNIGTAAGRGETLVGANGMFMTGAHVAHDCIVGDNAIFANNATLGGHVTVGDNVFLGGLCAIHQYCRIGSFAFIGGCAAVLMDVIPYASAIGNHARLAGLNIVGMKRRGTARRTIHQVRSAYRDLFEAEGVFADRLDGVEARYGELDEVRRILDFIRAETHRPLMFPRD